MLKYHKNKSRAYRMDYKFARRVIALHMGWNWVRSCCEHNSRRRMRIKARRWQTRHRCYQCQQGYFTADLVEHVEKKLGIHLEAKQGYHPVDEIFTGTCRECRFIMRGGLH